MAITPDRTTLLQVDIGDVKALRPSWHFRRKAAEIGPGPGLPAGVVPASGTFCTGDAWLLKPVGSTDVTEFLKLDTPAGSRFFGPTDANTAAGIQTALLFKPEFSIPGIGADPDYQASGLPAFQKGIPAGVDASTQTLAADAAAYPSPSPLTAQGYPLDRVLSGTRTYQENAPWRLLYDEPSGVPPDAFMTFLFGGPTDVKEVGHSGGEFALMVRGNREALLFERDKFRTADHGWRLQASFPLTGPDHSTQGPVKQSLTIIPYAQNRLYVTDKAFSLNQTLVGPFPFFSTFGGAATSEFASLVQSKLWVDLPRDTGHTHLRSQTGAGTVRLDIQRNYLDLVAIASMEYPHSGDLVDQPFFIDHALPAGTPITLHANGWTPPGTSITAYLRNAADGSLVPADIGTGTFPSVAGQSGYYVSFIFISQDGLQTPVLFDYSIEVPPVWGTRPRVPTLTSWIHSVHVTGPDLSPDQEQAFLHLNDPDDGLIVFRARDRVRCLLSVFSPILNRVIAHLGEFETKSPPAKLRGKPDYQWPVPGWRDFPNLTLQGLWARIVGQYALEPENFGRDTGAPKLANGTYPPWKLTDIIHYCFNQAGIPDDELDIPDVPLRLWSGDQNLFGDAGYILQQGADYARIIETLARDYFNAPIIRDANAGSRGMWRMGFAPSVRSTNYLASFLVDDPGAHGIEVMGVNSYSSTADVVPFQEGTFNTLPVAPEFTECVVSGISAQKQLIKTILPNADAVNNEASPDFLGFFLPFIRRPDPSLQTLEATNWVAHRLFDLAGHRQLWWEGRAPLLLVRDALDSKQNPNLYRPLRINDLVLCGGARALIRSVNPRWSDSDQVQWADYEGIFL